MTVRPGLVWTHHHYPRRSRNAAKKRSYNVLPYKYQRNRRVFDYTMEWRMPRSHQHLIVNARVGRDAVDVNDCRKWLDDLILLIGMRILVPSHCVQDQEPGNEGITGVVVLTTSHAVFHYWAPHSSEPDRLSFCLYSCESFDPQLVIDHIDDFWSASEYRCRFLDRTWDIVDIGNTIRLPPPAGSPGGA